jgi:hypothetical protein
VKLLMAEQAYKLQVNVNEFEEDKHTFAYYTVYVLKCENTGRILILTAAAHTL